MKVLAIPGSLRATSSNAALLRAAAAVAPPGTELVLYDGLGGLPHFSPDLDVEPIGKPVLLVSASPSGAGHAHAQLLEVLRTMSMQVVDGGGHVFSRARLDASGAITTPALIAALATGFARLAEIVDVGKLANRGA